MFAKINLVTNNDGSDTLRCDICGYKKKYYTLERPLRCPKCKDTGKKKERDRIDGDILGHWSSMKDEVCNRCGAKMIVVPREGHPNSKYWAYEANGEALVACSRGCLESNRNKPLIRKLNRR